MRIVRLWPLLALLAACGARTAPRVGDSGATGPCTEPPWLLFDYVHDEVADLYVVHADGSALHHVRLPAARSLFHSVSSDGRSMLYVQLAPSRVGPALGSVVVYDFVSRTPQVVHAGPFDSSPVLSPDGTLVAFAHGLDLHVVRRDGSDDRTLLSGPFVAGCCGWGYGQPIFADTRTLFFTTGGLIETIDTDGSAQTTVLTTELTVLPYASPTVSPDGRQLAAIIACAGMSPALRVYSVAALPAACTAGTVVVPGLGADAIVSNVRNAAWGPDDLIAFGLGDDVYVVPAGGGATRNLTHPLTVAGGAASSPSWAPGCIALP